MRFTFHIGPHKMATSFIQKSCRKGFGRQTGIQGIRGMPSADGRAFYVNAAQDLLNPIRKDLVQVYRDSPARPISEIARLFFIQIVRPLAHFEFAALVNENFIGSQLGQNADWPRMYPSCVANSAFHAEIQALSAAEGIDYRIAASFREQGSFIESSYLNVIRDAGRYVPFPDYCAKFDPDAIGWLAFFEEYGGKLGREAMSVVPFEAIQDGAQPFLDRFSAAFWPSVPLPALEETVREGMSRASLDVLREMTARRDAPAVPRDIMLAIGAALPKGEFGAPPLFSAEQRAAWRHRYADDSRAVFERFVEPPWQPVFDRRYA